MNFESLSPIESRIHPRDDTTLIIYGKYNVEISMINGIVIHLTNALYVSNLHKNLFSVCDHDKQGGGILTKNRMYHLLTQDDSLLASCPLQNSLYLLGTTVFQHHNIQSNIVTLLGDDIDFSPIIFSMTNITHFGNASPRIHNYIGHDGSTTKK